MKKILSFVLFLSVILSLFSCTEENQKPRTRTFYEYFDTVGTFYSYAGESEEKFNSLADRVEKELSEYHKLYDIYNEYEGTVNLATLNRTAGTGPKKVDKRIINLLLFAKEMYIFTGGKVNVAMGSVLKIWHDFRAAGKEVPPMKILTEANGHTDINSIVIDEENMTVEITDTKTSIEVGAIAKGYAAEMVAAMLEGEGKSGYVLDVGGNLRVIGTKKDGSGWTTGIRNPDTYAEKPYIYTLELKNTSALVTSGSYERFYTVNGVRYHHIISGETLMPENYYLSVSVKSASSALSDALSTAIFNMKPDEAKTFVEGLNGVFVVFVMPDGEAVTAGE